MKENQTVIKLDQHIMTYMYCGVKCPYCGVESLINAGIACTGAVHCPLCKKAFPLDFDEEIYLGFAKYADEFREQLCKVGLTLYFLPKPEAIGKFRDYTS